MQDTVHIFLRLRSFCAAPHQNLAIRLKRRGIKYGKDQLMGDKSR